MVDAAKPAEVPMQGLNHRLSGNDLMRVLCQQVLEEGLVWRSLRKLGQSTWRSLNGSRRVAVLILDVNVSRWWLLLLVRMCMKTCRAAWLQGFAAQHHCRRAGTRTAWQKLSSSLVNEPGAVFIQCALCRQRAASSACKHRKPSQR